VIARALGRSAGAVGNALKTLADRSQADLVPGRPARYRANPATGAAAGGISAAPVPRPAAPPEAAPAPAPAAAVPAAVTRPGGAAYRPRALADMPDVDALRRLRAAGIPALLYGPPGTGKTSLVEAAFADVITLAGDGDTTVADFAGEYAQRGDGSYQFTYSPLITAMQEGKVLFIDDCTLISPAVLAVTYPAMDGRREVRVKAHKGETITAADGFYVIGGHNPGVHGAVLTEALASRFTVQVKVGTDFDLAHALKIDSRAIQARHPRADRLTPTWRMPSPPAAANQPPPQTLPESGPRRKLPAARLPRALVSWRAKVPASAWGFLFCRHASGRFAGVLPMTRCRVRAEHTRRRECITQGGPPPARQP
jgi:nitric oxide reductase NorQ protein